jgi:hypothetical protein
MPFHTENPHKKRIDRRSNDLVLMERRNSARFSK